VAVTDAAEPTPRSDRQAPVDDLAGIGARRRSHRRCRRSGSSSIVRSAATREISTGPVAAPNVTVPSYGRKAPPFVPVTVRKAAPAVSGAHVQHGVARGVREHHLVLSPDLSRQTRALVDRAARVRDVDA
jgi:hypothetical protein